MTRAARLVATFLFVFAPSAVAGSIPLRSEVVRSDGTAVTLEGRIQPGRAIVELVSPRAAASGQRAARAAVLARFRSDLERVAALPASTIRHEYFSVFFGAAIEAPPATWAAIRSLDYVVAIHPDRIVRAYATDEPVDARPRVNAQGLGARGAGTVVAIIDTGIDYRHPALGGGYGPGFKVIGGHDFVNGDEDPIDDQGHGTHVAGTVAANAPDLIGVAPDARLLAYKVLDASGYGSSSDIIAAVEASVDPNGDGDRSDAADVVNLSLGGGGTADDPMARAVDAAVAAGVVVCVAAGNAGETASIGTPGAAAAAITVGAVDGAGVLAAFSSRGPTSKLLTFKPEIVAPGVGIVSSRLGGGVVSANGTSMATPHVAGVAALLRELHPDWTPARVKAAIVSGAVSMPGTPFARGAGRIDAARAANATLFLSEAGISFGLAHATAGSSSLSHAVTVTNASNQAESFSAVVSPAPSGTTISVNPSRVELAPGASATLDVTLSIDNAQAAFPAEPMVGGDIRFNGARGTSAFAIPWAMLRAARATVTYDGLSSGVVALTPSATEHPFQYDAGAFEMFVPPGSNWEVFLTGLGTDEEETLVTTLRYLIAEKRPIEGDVTIPFLESDATVRLTFAAQDAEGRFLRDLPEETELRTRYGMARLQFSDGDWRFANMTQYRGLRDIFVTPLSERYTLIPFESYIDAIAMRGFNVQHQVFRGPNASATLSAEPAGYLHAKLRWERPALPAELFVVCNAGGETRGSSFFFGSGGCAGREIAGAPQFDYYTTPETTPDAFSGFMFQTGSSTTPTLRGREGGIVASSEVIPPRTAPSIPNGGEASFGGGVFFPFALYGTTAGLPVLWPSPGHVGPYGETLRWDLAPAHWEAFDAAGARTSSGSIDPNRGVYPRAADAGSRLVIRRGWRHETGLTTAGTLEVTFGTTASDLTAPTLTSLRIADGAGRATSRLAVGEAATLHFSTGDLDHSKRMETKPSKSDATRVSYRIAGAAEWRPLTIALVDSESGSTNTLFHVPAGEIYRADLSEAARVPGLVDLRVEMEDLAGNRVVWTQEGALFVGGTPAPPSRARRVKRP